MDILNSEKLPEQHKCAEMGSSPHSAERSNATDTLGVEKNSDANKSTYRFTNKLQYDPDFQSKSLPIKSS